MEETRETVTDFLYLGAKVTAYGDCSHEIKRRLLLGRKATTNLDSILESRDINLPTNVCLVKAIVFLWSCMDVSWIIKRIKVAQSYATLWSHGLWPTRFLWGKSTGVNSISFSRELPDPGIEPRSPTLYTDTFRLSHHLILAKRPRSIK